MASNAAGVVAVVLGEPAGWAVARAMPRGRFGRPAGARDSAVDERTNAGAEPPAVAVGPRSDVLIAWPQFDGTSVIDVPGEDTAAYCCDQIRAATLLPAGRFGPTQRLSPRGWTSDHLFALISLRGVRVVLWQMDRQPTGARGFRVRTELATARPGRPFSHFRTILVAPTPASSQMLEDAVFLATGRLQITWQQDRPGKKSTTYTGDVSIGGKLSAVRRVDTAPYGGDGVASNAAGEQIIERGAGSYGPLLTAAAREPGEPFGVRTVVARHAATFDGLGIGPGGQTLITWEAASSPTESSVRYALGPHLLAGLTPRSLFRGPSNVATLAVAQAIGAHGNAAIQIEREVKTGGPIRLFASVGNARSRRMSPPRPLSSQLNGFPFNAPIIDGLGDAVFSWQTNHGPVVQTYTTG